MLGRMMRFSACLSILALMVLASCGEEKGGAAPDTSAPASRDLDPLHAVFGECSLAECQAVAKGLIEGLRQKRYTADQVRERLAFLGTKEREELRRLAPGLVPEAKPALAQDPELARIRALGFAKDAESRKQLESIAGQGATRPARALVATAALARRGDRQALESLKNQGEVESLSLWLDVVREKGVTRIVRMFLGEDPMEFDRALQLVDQFEELAWRGMVDPKGLEIGKSLLPLAAKADLDLARLAAIVTTVPGCRTAVLARKVLDHPQFTQLFRLVQERGRLMDLLSLIEIVDAFALRLRMREASELGDAATQAFWMARRMDLGDQEAIERWREKLEQTTLSTFFPGFVPLGATRLPGVNDALLQRLRAFPKDERRRYEILRGLAAWNGLPSRLGFPDRKDMEVLGSKADKRILEKFQEEQVDAALLDFLQSWDFEKRPELELSLLGKVEDVQVHKRVRELWARRGLGLRHELGAALAIGGDRAARAEHLGFLRAGIQGFRTDLSAIALTLNTDIETLPIFLKRVQQPGVLPEKLVAEILPLFGLAIDERVLPSRRLLRYELSGGKFHYSKIAGGPILGPEGGQ